MFNRLIQLLVPLILCILSAPSFAQSDAEIERLGRNYDVQRKAAIEEHNDQIIYEAYMQDYRDLFLKNGLAELASFKIAKWDKAGVREIDLAHATLTDGTVCVIKASCPGGSTTCVRGREVVFRKTYSVCGTVN